MERIFCLLLGSILVLTVLITGFFGYYQEASNTELLEGFKKLMPTTATVIRDGETLTLYSEDLVVGDLVKLKSGDCISADIRIIESNGLKVDNSSVTGESLAQNRTSFYTNKNPLESTNMVFLGTNVVEGNGTGIVVATADMTLMGRMARLATNLGHKRTLMQQELKVFVRYITILSVLIGLTFLCVSLSNGYDFFKSFAFFIAIIVANVPEGLLVTTTACLTLTAKRLAKKNCVVKRLDCIETLGSTTVICTDKTGTLTQNVMGVVHLYYNGEVIFVGRGETSPEMTPVFRKLCRVCVLCNNADYSNGGRDKILVGDATEKAIFKCMEKFVGNIRENRSIYPKV